MKSEKIKKIITLLIVLIAVCGLMFVIFNSLKSSDKKERKDNTESLASAEKRTIAPVNKTASERTIAPAKAGSVNIYMFWGEGCPHCKAQWEYLESIRKQYPNEFQVYGFEVWHNKNNLKLGNKFAKAVGDTEIQSVPYTIIGDQKFNGFSDGEKLLEAILQAKDKKTDIYFDKINKN